ncbi:hypothetical protein GTW40_30225 [Streptomyces sp. SID4985]|nr:hypothetical protein [Streptomyces sp. SID4985]
MRLGQRGSGSGDRSPVPAALPAVGTGGRCTEVRHLRPRTGPSGLSSRGAPWVHHAWRCRRHGAHTCPASSDGHSR